MVLLKAATRDEDEAELTDVQIIQRVLKEQSSDTTGGSTFLPRFGVASSSSKSSVSATCVRELEHNLADQEHNSIQTAERYHTEMEARMQEQDAKFK